MTARTCATWGGLKLPPKMATRRARASRRARRRWASPSHQPHPLNPQLGAGRADDGPTISRRHHRAAGPRSSPRCPARRPASSRMSAAPPSAAIGPGEKNVREPTRLMSGSSGLPKTRTCAAADVLLVERRLVEHEEHDAPVEDLDGAPAPAAGSSARAAAAERAAPSPPRSRRSGRVRRAQRAAARSNRPRRWGPRRPGAAPSHHDAVERVVLGDVEHPLGVRLVERALRAASSAGRSP